MSEFLHASESGPEGPARKQERLLTEVDHLLASRISPGVFLYTDDVEQNLETSVQEQAMPYAVTETIHVGELDRNSKERTFRWLGRTAVQVALSGYNYHEHQSALRRVDVEVDEARLAGTMEYGRARVFISPRMTRTDATLEEARSEHLGNDDAVRVSWLSDNSEQANRVMQSLLVRDIPYEAWVAMLRDSDNIFGKSMHVEDSGSSIDIMKLHSQLELPVGALPYGPVSIIEAVVGYIDDIETRRGVIKQIGKYHKANQEEMANEAKSKAAEWLEFEKELAESLAEKEATFEIRRFIIGLQDHWSDEDLQVIRSHAKANTHYEMSRQLAAVLESAQQKVLSARAAILVDPDHVRAQLNDERAFQMLQDTEKLIYTARASGIDYRALQMQVIQSVASHNIQSGGGGCAGVSATEFGVDDPLNPLREEAVKAGLTDGIGNPEDRSNWKWKKGVCVVEVCKTRPGETKIGPCDVCEHCQAEFDKGKDPTEGSPIGEKKEHYTSFSAILNSIFEVKNEQFRTAA